MKNKVKEMEEEAEQLRKEQEEAGEGEGEDEESAEADGRSIYVGQVDYSATPEELQEHFAACGTVNRVTILCYRFRNPKGYAYIEFAEPEAVEAAVALNESEFKGRQLKVTAKRTNVHGFGKGGRAGGKGGGKGGKGGKGKGGGWGKGYGKGGYKGGYQPYYRPRSRGRGYRPY
jgi:polyadenylate-binding protein 2